ncbi:MAG: hypothetical protein HC765_07210 [Brachymonas sp.]|nr:hypothetical protein [Brachymonas sp.]
MIWSSSNWACRFRHWTNFIALRDTNPDAARAGTIAQVITALKQEVGAIAESQSVNETQTQALLSVVVINNLSALAESVSSQTSSATVTAANLAANQGINSTTVATQAQIASSIVNATTDTNTVTTPTPFVTLRDFRYTSPTNWNYRVFTGNDVTRPDGFKRSNDVRVNSSAFPYVRNLAYFNETGNNWYACPSDGFEAIVYKDATATVPGESTFCNTFRDSSRRTSEDISGQTISAVISRIRNSGLDGYNTWAGTTTSVAVFPAGSQLRYQINTRLATPIAQDLASKVRVFKNTNASAFEQWPFAATLDEMIEYYSGNFNTAFGAGNSGGASTDGMGQYADGSYQVSGMQAVKNYRAAFQRINATSGNARIYQCRRNATPNTNTNCFTDSATLLTTTYTIETLGDARVLKFAALPAELTSLRKNSRVYVERGGAVFYGFKDILSVDTTVRLNVTAWDAMPAQFPGVTSHTDPVAPVAADTGTWLRDMRRGVTASGSETFSIRAWNFTVNGTNTGGTSNEVRLNFTEGVPQPFARNTLYLIGGQWRSSDDADQQCPSNGIGVDVFTFNPRSSVFCNYSNGTATSFDVELTGKNISTTLAEMRLYGSFDFGRDYSLYGPIVQPSDPEFASFNSAVFPADSKLRYQVGQTTSSAPQLNTTSQVFNGTVSFANLAAMRASFSGNYNSGTANGGNTLGVYSYQTNGTIASGTTGQKRLRIAFDPAVGSNAARWFMCDQSSTAFNTINCVAVHDTTWSVTMRRKNVLRTASRPAGIDAQRSSRTLLIEHNAFCLFWQRRRSEQ